MNCGKEHIKILMIAPNLSMGGSERVISNLTFGLPEEWEIDILLDYNAIVYPYRGNVLFVKDSKSSGYNGTWDEFFTIIKKVKKLRAFKKEKKYDVYISHLHISNLANIISGHKNCGTILTAHYNMEADMQDRRFPRLQSILLKKCYKLADNIVAVSKGVKDGLSAKFNIPEQMIRDVWNGSDIPQIREKSLEELSPAEQIWVETPHVIATMGRYMQCKGQWHLIRAFTEIVKVYSDAKLLILGQGELEGYYKELIKAYRLEGKVILCGFLANPFKIIRRSALFVMPSIYEGFGYALEEALCCDVSCIASDFPYGAREILGYPDLEMEHVITESQYLDYGTLVPRCSGIMHDSTAALEREEKIMADAMLNLLKNDELRQHNIDCNKPRLDDFSITKMTDQWTGIIKDTVFK